MTFCAAIAFTATGCGDDHQGRTQNDDTVVNFAPNLVRVGEQIEVSGSGFEGDEVDIVLIPSSRFQTLAADALDGKLFILDSAPLQDGSFAARLIVPSTVTSQDEEEHIRVEPGEYRVGAFAPGELRAVGPLTILP